MHELITIDKVKEDQNGTQLIITIPNRKLQQMLIDKHIKTAELRLDDGRHISAEQRKKAYATIRDIADYTGNPSKWQEDYFKSIYKEKFGGEEIHLSNCTMDEGREFINILMDFVIEHGVQLSAKGIDRTDDIGRYLYYCIKHKKCCICGRAGEIHHEDTIGMGNDRNKVDDSNHRKICLCRTHHTQAHTLGIERFRKMYKVYGIVIRP